MDINSTQGSDQSLARSCPAGCMCAYLYTIRGFLNNRGDKSNVRVQAPSDLSTMLVCKEYDYGNFDAINPMAAFRLRVLPRPVLPPSFRSNCWLYSYVYILVGSEIHSRGWVLGVIRAVPVYIWLLALAPRTGA